MSYIENICQALIDTLGHTAGLHVHQLAGHVANLEFWMDEVRHALGAIDGYEERFSRMSSAQQGFLAVADNEAARVERSEGYEKPLGVGVRPATRVRLRRELVAAAERLLDRCLTERLINLVTVDDLRERASIVTRHAPHASSDAESEEHRSR